jgi:hypothetical protein
MFHGISMAIGLAALFAASECAAEAGKVKRSTTGAVPWTMQGALKICMPKDVAHRDELDVSAKDDFYFVGDEYSGVPPMTTTWYDNINGSLTAQRFDATAIDYTLELTQLDAYEYLHDGTKRPASKQDGYFLLIEPKDAKREEIRLRYVYGYIDGYFISESGSISSCSMVQNSNTKVSIGEKFTLNVRLEDNKFSLHVNGELACSPVTVSASLFKTAPSVQVTYGPYKPQTTAVLFEISRQTSPYPMTDSALCSSTDVNHIEVRYCSSPPQTKKKTASNMGVMGLLASQVGVDGALRYEREGPIPPMISGADSSLFFLEESALDELHSLSVFAESSDSDSDYAQCISEVLVNHVVAVDFAPGVYVKADKNDGAEIASTLIETQAPGAPTVYQTLRTVPLSMQLKYPLKTVHLAYSVCEIDGADNLLRSLVQARALVLNPQTDSYEATQWLKIPAAKTSELALRKRENIFWTIEVPFAEVMNVEFQIDGADTDGYGCLDAVTLGGKAAREMSSSWIANADWRTKASQEGQLRCGTFGCAQSAFAFFEYAVCGVEVLHEYPTGDAVQKSESEERVASASCSNLNRFEKQTCAVSQEVETRTLEETTVQTNSAYAFSNTRSMSRSRDEEWDNKASGERKLKIGGSWWGGNKIRDKSSFSKSNSGSTSDRESETTRESRTESTAEGIRHSTETTRNVICSGEATVPSGYKQAYGVVMKQSNYTQKYASDLKLIYCAEMWRPGSDADDPANFKIVKNVPSSARFVESELCEVVFAVPTSLKNAMSCAEELNEAMLNDAKRFVVCNEDDPALYDGCQCNAMDSLRGGFCECVDQAGNMVAGTERFIAIGKTWQQTCASMSCKHSRFRLDSGAAAAAAVGGGAAASVAVIGGDGATMAAAAVGCAASLSLLAMFARRRWMAKRGGADVGRAKKSDATHSYGAMSV